MGQFCSDPGRFHYEPIPPSKRDEKPNTHFIVARICGKEVVENAHKLQRQIITKYPDLKMNLVKPHVLHLSLFLFNLEPDQIQPAQIAFSNALSKLRGECYVTFNSITSSEGRVLVANVTDGSRSDLNQLRELMR